MNSSSKAPSCHRQKSRERGLAHRSGLIAEEHCTLGDEKLNRVSGMATAHSELPRARTLVIETYCQAPINRSAWKINMKDRGNPRQDRHLKRAATLEPGAEARDRH